MKILVVSDSHGDRDILVELRDKYKESMDQLFHCGDSELEASDDIWKAFITVRGNMDFDQRYELEQIVDVESNRIFMAHGHYLDVKSSMAPLLEAAKRNKANFAFFGHSHELGVEKRDGILLLNPGSILQPRGKYHVQTYAIVEMDERGITVSYYDRSHQPVKGLVVRFSKM